VSGTRITYSHVDTAGTTSVLLFDTALPPSSTNPFPVVVVPVGATLFNGSIRGNIVTYEDHTGGDLGNVFVHDLAANTNTQLTQPDTAEDVQSRVSPGGNLVVWQHCPNDDTHCDIWKAVKANGTWTASGITNGFTHANPDTNGDVIVYDSATYPRPVSGSDLFLRDAANIEYEIELPGDQSLPRIAGDFITFLGEVTPGDLSHHDLFLYQLSTNRLWNVTNTPLVDESLSGVTVLPTGEVLVVYESDELVTSTTVHALRFTVPSVADAVPPSIAITTPANSAIYPVNSVVDAQYSCSDSASGVATCQGTVANGAAIATASAGPQTFTVNASDHAGNTANQSVSYTIGYNICPLYDATKARKSGSTYPIQIQLCDAGGHNVSSSSIVVHAVNVVQVSTNAPGTLILDDAGNSNPDFDFRYDATTASYLFNLKTTGFATGTYTLGFTAGADPIPHTALFQIK
jgi:hypothetical protein